MHTRVQPYALHATFQFSGTPGKRHRMREFMLFEDPPEYYDHKNGFISFAVSVTCPVILSSSSSSTQLGYARQPEPSSDVLQLYEYPTGEGQQDTSWFQMCRD